MQLSASSTYQHQDLRELLRLCPVCGSSKQLIPWLHFGNNSVHNGSKGISCHNCKLKLSFGFQTTQEHQIVDSYTLDYLKIGNLEFKNDNQHLALYMNSVYVRDLEDSIDFGKCRNLMLLA